MLKHLLIVALIVPGLGLACSNHPAKPSAAGEGGSGSGASSASSFSTGRGQTYRGVGTQASVLDSNFFTPQSDAPTNETPKREERGRNRSVGVIQ